MVKQINEILEGLTEKELAEVYKLSCDSDSSKEEKLISIFNEHCYAIYGERVKFLTTSQLNEMKRACERIAIERYFENYARYKHNSESLTELFYSYNDFHEGLIRKEEFDRLLEKLLTV